MHIRQYTEFEIVNRIGPLFQPCTSAIGARDAFRYIIPMTEVLRNSERGGVGLAANQVGLNIPLFIFIMHGSSQPVYRPQILKAQGYEDGKEECLSLPGVVCMVDRYKSIEVDFIAFKNNKRKRMVLSGMMARVFQHEYDHLQGRTILDYHRQLNQ